MCFFVVEGRVYLVGLDLDYDAWHDPFGLFLLLRNVGLFMGLVGMVDFLFMLLLGCDLGEEFF